MHCVAHYDNSEGNLSNPDPKVLVRWGPQTWQEMMIGYFDVAIPVASLGASLNLIRRVVVTLTAQSAGTDEVRSFTLTSSVRPRNL